MERGMQMSKQKDPAFLFYPADFLIGTMDMTDEEAGIYIRLLCRQHQKGNIRPDLKINGQLMGDLPEEILSKFCRDNQGNYYNKRLKAEIDKRVRYSESRKTNGSKGGRPKKHMETICKPHGKPYANHTENENINENEIVNEIVDFLNGVCSKRYRPDSKEIQKHIKARLGDGFTVDDFKTVIRKKFNEWHGTEMEKYLRPSTLFSGKFEEYLNQSEGKQKNKNQAAENLNEFYGMAAEWAKGEDDEQG